MKYMDGFLKRAAALLMGLVLIGTNVMAVSAAESADLELSRTGTIELTLTDSDGATVSGGAVTIYEVAKLYLDDGNMAYEYTQSFAGCTATLDVTDTSLASVLADYARKNSVSGEKKSIGEDGKVRFTNLELGLYLIVQTTESANYETISPFAVTLPIEEDGVWNYTVNASPKVGTVMLKETQTEEDTDSDSGSGSGSDSSSDSESESSTTVYVSTTILPQTGQLYWPIPLLVIGGGLFLIIGRCLKKKEDYAA
ncbi:MAG: hypothetical protein LUC98_12965 [Lachnospiraceae bacterium]|nr:hypothetical protein [Lachnospiraceae bacterium]